MIGWATSTHAGAPLAALLKKRLPSLRRGCGAALMTGLLASSVAHAAVPTEVVGPVGTVGATGRTEPGAPARAHSTGTAQRALAPAPASAPARGSSAAQGNRIEVSGNTASGVQCGEQGSASVNSVDVQGARLQGKTLIVQGRNARNVHGPDCAARADQPNRRGDAGGQTNSIRIR